MVTNWIDVFKRQEYRDIIYNSLIYCQQENGLDVYGYRIMPSHLHSIIGTGTEKGVLPYIVRDFKAYISRGTFERPWNHRGEFVKVEEWGA